MAVSECLVSIVFIVCFKLWIGMNLPYCWLIDLLLVCRTYFPRYVLQLNVVCYIDLTWLYWPTCVVCYCVYYISSFSKACIIFCAHVIQFMQKSSMLTIQSLLKSKFQKVHAKHIICTSFHMIILKHHIDWAIIVPSNVDKNSNS